MGLRFIGFFFLVLRVGASLLLVRRLACTLRGTDLDAVAYWIGRDAARAR